MLAFCELSLGPDIIVPQADRPAGESVAVPSVELLTFEVPTHCALLGGHLALLGIFLISFSLTPEFSSCILQAHARVSPGSSLALCLVFIHAEPVLATSS